MPPSTIVQTYVTFEFSPEFIYENKKWEEYLIEENTSPDLETGTVDRICEEYEEVKVDNRDLGTLQVPKGAFRFYFYDRLIATDPEYYYANTGELIEMYSDSLDRSVWYYLESEGEIITREELEGDGATDHEKVARAEGSDFHRALHGSMLTRMDKHDCNRLFSVGSNDYPMEPDDLVISPAEVQMVDTIIPWPIN